MDVKRVLLALKRKDERALEQIIDYYTPYVSTIVYNIIVSCMSLSDVEEVSSDVFFALWQNADKVENLKLKAYLSAIARNKAKERMRKTGKDLLLEDDIIIMSKENLEHDMEIREQAKMLGQAVLSLQHPDREIFLRHYYYYQSLAQIAEELEMNISTIKTKLRRGRQKLKSILFEGGYDVE